MSDTVGGPGSLLHRWRRLIRGVFLLYALALVTATHWPNLKIEGPVERPDLWIHMTAFGLGVTLLALSGLFGTVWSFRNIGASVGVGLVYAAIDELTQAIPVLHRTAAFDDYLADATGMVLAGGVLLLIAWRLGAHARTRGDTTSSS